MEYSSKAPVKAVQDAMHREYQKHFSNINEEDYSRIQLQQFNQFIDRCWKRLTDKYSENKGGFGDVKWSRTYSQPLDISPFDPDLPANCYHCSLPPLK